MPGHQDCKKTNFCGLSCPACGALLRQLEQTGHASAQLPNRLAPRQGGTGSGDRRAEGLFQPARCRSPSSLIEEEAQWGFWGLADRSALPSYGRLPSPLSTPWNKKDTGVLPSRSSVSLAVRLSLTAGPLPGWQPWPLPSSRAHGRLPPRSALSFLSQPWVSPLPWLTWSAPCSSWHQAQPPTRWCLGFPWFIPGPQAPRMYGLCLHTWGCL